LNNRSDSTPQAVRPCRRPTCLLELFIRIKSILTPQKILIFPRKRRRWPKTPMVGAGL
jgi:hypothetical protein